LATATSTLAARDRAAARQDEQAAMQAPTWFDTFDSVDSGALPEEYEKLAQFLHASRVLVGEFHMRDEALAAARAALAECEMTRDKSDEEVNP
jgi:hypothetical protein